LKKRHFRPLTGIPNRRFMEMQLDKFFNKFQRYGNTFCLYFIDVDKFKYFNDKYGHDVGDKVLKVVANTLISVLRRSDAVGRWGGDEFVAIAIKQDNTTLRTIGERINTLVKNSHLNESETPLNVTVSIGGTVIRKTDTLDSIINRADSLMLQAKKEGEDRVIVDEQKF